MTNPVCNREILRIIVFAKAKPSLDIDHAGLNLFEVIKHDGVIIRSSNTFMLQLYIYCLMKD